MQLCSVFSSSTSINLPNLTSLHPFLPFVLKREDHGQSLLVQHEDCFRCDCGGLCAAGRRPRGKAGQCTACWHVGLLCSSGTTSTAACHSPASASGGVCAAARHGGLRACPCCVDGGDAALRSCASRCTHTCPVPLGLNSPSPGDNNGFHCVCG